MRCEEARDQLWPPEAPRLVEDRVLEARRHVNECESCRDYLAFDSLLLERLRSARRVVAPPEVRERVFDALARERLRSGPTPSTSQTAEIGRNEGRRYLPAGLVSAAIALAAGVLILADPFPALREGSGDVAIPVQQAGSAFAEDFLRRAAQAEHIETSDPAEVQRFLAREFGTSIGTPLSFPGLDLAGAEVCILEGVRGAVVLYKRDGRVLYHYLIPMRNGNEAEPALSEAAPAEWSGESSYPSVVTWRSDGFEQALVSDLPSDELLDVAQGLAARR